MSSRLTFKPVVKNNWHDLECLFESKGGPHHCWCMVWREMNEGKTRGNKADKKGALKGLIDRNIPIGLLCYHDLIPVAWCSIAPRETYRELGGDKSLKDVWSLACFFIRREYRQQNMTKKLILEALKYAKENGAKYVEAYPVEVDSPSYHFMGFRSTFEKLGFEFKHKAGTRRNVMTINLKQHKPGIVLTSDI